jgi:hypothetical protein
MNTKTLKSILIDELNASSDGGRLGLPSGTRVTVFLSTAGVPIPVPKVTAVTLKKDYAILDSEDGRVFTDASDFVAIRADEEASASGRVGF